MHERKKRTDHDDVTDKVKLCLDVFPPTGGKELKLYRLRRNDDSSVDPLKFRERNAGEAGTGRLKHLNKLNQYVDRKHKEPEPVMEEVIHVIKPALEKLIRRNEERLQPLNNEVPMLFYCRFGLLLVAVLVVYDVICPGIFICDQVVSLLRGGIADLIRDLLQVRTHGNVLNGQQDLL